MSTPAIRKAVAKYTASRGRIDLRPTFEQQEEIKAHAAARGESVQAFLLRAAAEQIRRDNNS